MCSACSGDLEDPEMSAPDPTPPPERSWHEERRTEFIVVLCLLGLLGILGILTVALVSRQ